MRTPSPRRSSEGLPRTDRIDGGLLLDTPLLACPKSTRAHMPMQMPMQVSGYYV